VRLWVDFLRKRYAEPAFWTRPHPPGAPTA